MGKRHDNSAYVTHEKKQANPAISHEKITPGPASVLATMPVSTKTPLPIVPPTPRQIRSKRVYVLLMVCVAMSALRTEASFLKNVRAQTRPNIRNAMIRDGGGEDMICWLHQREVSAR